MVETTAEADGEQVVPRVPFYYDTNPDISCQQFIPLCPSGVPYFAASMS